MISDKVYCKQIERLEAAYMYTIDRSSLDVWREELESENIIDADLIKGIDFIINNSAQYKMRPHLGNLKECCGRAKMLRWEKEQAEKRNKIIKNNEKNIPNDCINKLAKMGIPLRRLVEKKTLK